MKEWMNEEIDDFVKGYMPGNPSYCAWERSRIAAAEQQNKDDNTQREPNMQSIPKPAIVWSPDGKFPVVQHPSIKSAQKEAERLATQHPGKHFYVAELKGFCTVPKPPPAINWTHFSTVTADGKQIIGPGMGEAPQEKE